MSDEQLDAAIAAAVGEVELDVELATQRRAALKPNDAVLAAEFEAVGQRILFHRQDKPGESTDLCIIAQIVN